MTFTRLLLLLLVMAFPVAGLWAQDGEQALLRGKVMDEATDQPLEFATVTVLAKDSEDLITGGTTDIDGNFEIPAPIGTYDIKVDYLSFLPTTIEDVTISEDNPEVDLGTITMSPDAQVIEGVEVVGEKSQLQIGLDKRVFNVGKDLSRVGGSAADLLDNIPSVVVDGEGNISLRGSQGVQILIDGKPSGLIGIGDAQGLQLLQSNMIESVEIITNPSAKYQAEGTAGIINIILKKEKKEGINGSFDLNTGWPHNHGAAANINVRRNWINLFGNFGVNYRERLGGGNTFQQFFRPDTTFFTELDRDRTRTGFGFNTQVGADIYLNSSNILTTSFLYRQGEDDNFNTTIYRDYDEAFILDDITERVDNEKEDESTVEYNLNYRRTFDKEKQELTVDIQYQNNNEVESSDIEERLVDEMMRPIGTDPLLQRSLNDEGERRLLVQADYTHPLGKEGRLEAGYFSTFRHIDNEYRVEEQDEAGEWQLLENFSNIFDYDENIYALYTTAGNKFGRFSIQGGLRAEFSDIRTELEETNEVNDRTYLNLFPSVYLGYELPADQNVQVSYSRRIRRPRFWDLNPFFSFSDNRNIRSGNPDLDPELTDSYEITYLKYWDNVSISSSAYYRHTTDVIDRITRLLNDSTTLSRPENLLEEDNFGLEMIVSSDFGKWWKLNGSFNFFRSITDGGNLGEEFSADTYAWTGRINSRMTFWKKLDFQLMFNYRGPQLRPQGERKAIAYLDAGLSMEILKGKGNLNLNVRDVFNSRRYRFITDIEDLYSEGDFRWSVRTVTLGFTYRLNQNDKRGGGRRGGGNYGGDEF